MRKQHLLQDGVIKLRAPEPEDLEVMYSLENDPDMWLVSNTTVPYSRYVLRQYIERCSNDVFTDKEVRLMIQLADGETVVGTVDLIDVSPLHGRAEIGIAVLEEYRHRGYAQQAVGLLVRYVSAVLSLHQLYAYVAVDNHASVDLFEACGFKHKVVLHDWLRRQGGYGDVYLMQRFIF